GGVDGLVAFSTHAVPTSAPVTVLSLGQQSATTGSAFNGQTRNFLDVGVGVTPGKNSNGTQLLDLDFTGFSFSAPGLTAGDAFGIEDRITHYLDDPLGFTAASPTTPTGNGVPTGPGLGNSNGSAGGVTTQSTTNPTGVMTLGALSSGGTPSVNAGTSRPIV